MPVTPSQPSQALWEALKQKWAAEGLEVPPGVSESELAEFEHRYGVRLPDDMREYLLTVNGMGTEWVFDSEFVSFWSLDRIKPISEDWQERWNADEASFGDYIGKGLDVLVHFDEAKTLFCFADHSICLPTFAIRFARGDPSSCPIFAICSDYPGPCLRSDEPLASSFTKFVRRYLNENGASLSCPP